MPRFRDYAAETSASGLPPTRSATASDFNNAGGEVLGDAVGKAFAIVEHKQAQDDVTNVRVKLAQARAEWDVHFRERANASEPGDPNFASKFSQDFSDYLGKARDIAQTREGQRTFDELAANLSGHFAEKGGLFQVQSAGVKAKQDFDIAQRAYATSVITDPTSYSSVLDQAVAELQDRNGQYGRLDNATRQALETKMRDTLAQSYVNGLIDNGAPELAHKQLMAGVLDDQLDPTHKQRLIQSANAGITAKRVGAEHAAALAAKEEKARVAQINDDLMGKFVAGTLTMGDVRAAKIPAFGDGSQHTWVTMLKQQTRDMIEKPIKTIPSVMVAAFERINLPAGDPRKITSLHEINKLYTQQQVSWADLSHLQKAFKDQQTEDGQRLGQVQSDFMKGIKAQLDKSTMNRLDEAGGERMFRFTVYVNKQVEAARKANEDPYQLFNPASPKYLGKAIPQFQSGAQRAQANLAGRVGASLDKAAPRKSLDDIFKGAP
jgi:hypothetical protein